MQETHLNVSVVVTMTGVHNILKLVAVWQTHLTKYSYRNKSPQFRLQETSKSTNKSPLFGVKYYNAQ